MSKLGEFLGKDKTEQLIAGAAPAFTIATAAIFIGTSLALRKSNPELSRYVLGMAIENILQSAFQALSALYNSGLKGSDNFLKLWTAASILLLPLQPLLPFRF